MSDPIRLELYLWIDRAREAEARVEELEERLDELEKEIKAKWPPSWEKAPGWALEVCDFLKEVLSPIPMPDARSASRLLTAAIALGIIPEPDCKPGLIKCGKIHDFGVGPTKCALPLGHSGLHEFADKREGWR